MNSEREVGIKTLSLLTVLSVLSVAASAADIKTDRGVYPEPALPTLPAPGDTMVDPTFGTTILRVTGPDDGTLCTTIYSYWPSFNKDATLLTVSCDGSQVLYDFDPDNLAVSGKRPLFAAASPQGGMPRGDDAIWSGAEENVIYGHEGPRIWRYDVSTQEYTLVKDLANHTANLIQMSKSIDDNVFAFSKQDADWNVTGLLVWQRDIDSVPADETTATLDEVQIDKSGRFLIQKTGQQGAGAIEVRVHDFQQGTVEELTDNGPDFGPGHSDNGTGIVIGADNWNNQYTGRNLTDPHTFWTVLGFGSDWSQDGHLSMLADNEDWALVSLVNSGALPSSGVFENEILQAATDGSESVRRLCHHRNVSSGSDYWMDYPFANISRDGRFVAFSSNWGGSGRKDVFVLRIRPELVSSVQPAPSGNRGMSRNRISITTSEYGQIRILLPHPLIGSNALRVYDAAGRELSRGEIDRSMRRR